MTSYPYNKSFPVLTDIDLSQEGRTDIYDREVETIISGIYLVDNGNRASVALELHSPDGRATLERTESGGDLQIRETFYLGKDSRLSINVIDTGTSSLTSTALVFATQ